MIVSSARLVGLASLWRGWAHRAILRLQRQTMQITAIALTLHVVLIVLTSRPSQIIWMVADLRPRLLTQWNHAHAGNEAEDPGHRGESEPVG